MIHTYNKVHPYLSLPYLYCTFFVRLYVLYMLYIYFTIYIALPVTNYFYVPISHLSQLPKKQNAKAIHRNGPDENPKDWPV